MTSEDKWPEHIVDCLWASIKYGSETKFFDRGIVKNLISPELHSLSTVLRSPMCDWKHLPYIEEWGIELVAFGGTSIYWQKSLKCSEISSSRIITKSEMIARHYRRVDLETGKTIFFETLEVFK